MDLTTKARHWMEVDVTYSAWQWTYLELNAKYQYGSLPPLFSLVDQQVSFGFLLQAKQSHKPSLRAQQSRGAQKRPVDTFPNCSLAALGANRRDHGDDRLEALIILYSVRNPPVIEL